MRALADLRAERAEALLRDDRLTALEAGLAAGFGSPTAFTRAFRRRTGRSPAAWRRAMGETGRDGRLAGPGPMRDSAPTAGAERVPGGGPTPSTPGPGSAEAKGT